MAHQKHHKNLFSEYSKNLSENEKKELILNYYLKYRNEVETEIKKYTKANNKVIHLSVHSFTPILNTIERQCDIGLLFDSRKPLEKAFCVAFKKEILKIDNTIKVRFNYPYLGKADGFTTYLRKQFLDGYCGIELEINQKFSSENIMNENIKKVVFNALKETISTI